MIPAHSPDRSTGRLLTVDACGRLHHLRRADLATLFRSGDLIVANDAATLPASLHGEHQPTGSPIEVRLAAFVDAADPTRFVAVAFGAGDHRTVTESRPLPPALVAGDRLLVGPLVAVVERLLDHPRLIELRFDGDAPAVFAGLARHGKPIQYAHVPAPLALWDVWTSLAARPFAFEAPSAGFALDWQTLTAWRQRGIELATLTHAAGISSTGDPDLDERLPFDEPYVIPGPTAQAIAETRARGGSIIAIGTTVVRALESAATGDGVVHAGPGVAQGRIGPATQLHVVDVVLSGMHEPGESHFELLRAFAAEPVLRHAHRATTERNYRTHEFGDSMLVEGPRPDHAGSDDRYHRPMSSTESDRASDRLVSRPIEVVGCHAEGEVGDVIVGGVAPPPGATVWEQSRWIAGDGRLRRHVLHEPRGGVFKHVNLIVPAIDPAADIGFIIMEPEDTPPMSGSNSMCVATVALETGIVAMTEPTTVITLEAPAGLVRVVAECSNGKVTSVTIRNVASFAAGRDLALDVDGVGSLRVDTAFGGDSFVMVDAADLGLAIVPESARDLAAIGARITGAANAQLTFEHPTADWAHFSFCQIAEPLERTGDGEWTMVNTVVVEPGKLDRSPTGTGVSARMALLRAQGVMAVGDRLRMRSVIGSEFVGQIDADTTVGELDAIIPLVTGRAWRYGRFVYELDPTDPWPNGYRVADTWPMSPT